MSEHKETIVVDEHPLFREGVAGKLLTEPDFDVVAQGASADDALDLACEMLPDLLLLDINMRGALDAIRAIAASCPVIKVVVLTASVDEETVVAALQAGARAYILKDIDAEELVTVLRAVCAGDVYIAPSLAAGLLLDDGSWSPMDGTSSLMLERLTSREREILEGVRAGLGNKEIGKHLHLSEKTVKHHMTNILQKLQARNRVEAALLAERARRLKH